MAIFVFLGFILILVFVIIFIVLAFLGNIIRSIFGFGRRTPKHFYGENTTSSTHTADNHSSAQTTASASTDGKKKIFADDEGEYVEFEEVK
jgi:hypothetical protein